jgi:hypothetical protein
MTAIADAPLLRLRLEHLLATADVEPRSLPPAAIFIVRHLADPAPHRLLSESQSVRAPAVWQDAARDRLDDLYRQAAYPADGPVPWSATTSGAGGGRAFSGVCRGRQLCPRSRFSGARKSGACLQSSVCWNGAVSRPPLSVTSHHLRLKPWRRK